MKKIKVSEATNLQLDWLVAKCEHGEAVFLHRREPLRIVHKNGLPVPAINDPEGDQFALYLEYTTDPDQMHPIIERIGGLLMKRWLESNREGQCQVEIHNYDGDWIAFGPTLLIAAARCYVMSKLGEEVEVPEELT